MQPRTPLILALSLASLALVPAAADAQGTTAGIKAGINLANLDISGQANPPSSEQRMGLIAGAFVARDFNPRVGLQIEGLFSQKGAKFPDIDGSSDLDIHLDYLEIPVLIRGNLKASDTTMVHVFGGIVPAFKLAVSQKLGDVELPDDEPLTVSSIDTGIAVGAMLDIKKVLVDVRYTFGLTSIDDEGGDTKVKNRTFSIMGGFRFK